MTSASFGETRNEFNDSNLIDPLADSEALFLPEELTHPHQNTYNAP